MFDRIEAPAKELVVIDAACHLLFNEALDDVLPVLVPPLLAQAHTMGREPLPAP